LKEGEGEHMYSRTVEFDTAHSFAVREFLEEATHMTTIGIAL
jgi:hypothetical protein